MNLFDEKYYEDGINNHISGYENYHWMPERTIREATSLINNLNFDTVLDFGCAKGFMVYAMSLLGKQSYGVDISDYAGSTVYDLTNDLNENFADGKVKGKSRPGRVKKAGASCKGSVSSLRAKASKYGGEKGKMYHWCANMKSGRSKK